MIKEEKKIVMKNSVMLSIIFSFSDPTVWKVQRASCSVSASLHLQIAPWFLNLISYVLSQSYIS